MLNFSFCMSSLSNSLNITPFQVVPFKVAAIAVVPEIWCTSALCFYQKELKSVCVCVCLVNQRKTYDLFGAADVHKSINRGRELD